MNEKPKFPAPIKVLKLPVHFKKRSNTTLCGITWSSEDQAPPYVVMDGRPLFVSESGGFICEGLPDPDYDPPSWKSVSKGPTEPLSVGINASDVCPRCLRLKPLIELGDSDL